MNLTCTENEECLIWHKANASDSVKQETTIFMRLRDIRSVQRIHVAHAHGFFRRKGVHEFDLEIQSRTMKLALRLKGEKELTKLEDGFNMILSKNRSTSNDPIMGVSWSSEKTRITSNSRESLLKGVEILKVGTLHFYHHFIILRHDLGASRSRECSIVTSSAHICIGNRLTRLHALGFDERRLMTANYFLIRSQH